MNLYRAAPDAHLPNLLLDWKKVEKCAKFAVLALIFGGVLRREEVALTL